MTVSTEDRLLITELFARYNWALDTCDGPAVAALFVEGGTFDGSASSWSGVDEITDMVEGARAGDGEYRSQHWTINSVFVGDSERCTIASTSIAPSMSGSQFRMAFMAYYVDTCVKVDGQWLFERRKFRLWDGIASDVPALLSQEAGTS